MQTGASADLGGYHANETFISAGTITAAYGSGSFSIYGKAFTNTGSLVARAGSTLDLSSTTTFTNFKAGTLTAGSYEADAGSILQVSNNIGITTDAATLTLAGAGSEIQSFATGPGKQTLLESKLTTIAATGVLNVLGGRGFTGTAAFVDNGVVTLGGGKFAETSITLNAGARLSGYGTLATAVANAGMLEAAGGLLVLSSAITGTGLLQADAGATLEIATSTSNGQTLSFNGQSTVRIDSPTSFASPIANLGAGDLIVLPTAAATSVALNGSTLQIALSGGATLNYALTNTPAGERIDISSDGHTLTTYREAAAGAHTPEPVAFGNHHVGDVASAFLALTNTAAADGYSEALDAGIGGATGGVSVTGSLAGLGAGMTSTGALAIAVNTQASGVITGSATISLATDGTGTDGASALAIGTQAVTASGTVYAYAVGSLGAATIAFGNHHVADMVASQALSLTNTVATGGYGEALDATLSGAGNGVTTSGTLAGLAAGATDFTSLVVGFSTATAGAYSDAVTVNLTSDGAGIDGLGITALAGQTVTVTGTNYNYAAGQLGSTTVNLGVIHAGSAVLQTLTIGNAAPSAYSEALDAAFQGGTGGVASSGTLSGLAGGASNGSALQLGVDTTTTGSFTGSETLGLVSDGNGIDGLGTTALASQTLTVAATVDNYALAAFLDTGGPAISGAGTAFTVNLGSAVVGAAALHLNLGALNAATGLADLLGGTISTSGGIGFTNTGFGTFTGLGAGQGELAQAVTLSTAGTAGVYSETVVLAAAGSNASGYTGTLATETLTVTGTLTPAGSSTYVLAVGANTIVGADGGDVFQAPEGAINSRDSLTGGSGGNTLQLTGGGLFDIGAPRVFANIQTVTATEGQAGIKGSAATTQTVFLRDGANETLNVVAGTAAAGNTNPEAVAIYSSTATNTINLAGGHDAVTLSTGTDTITLGAVANSVTAGGGTAHVLATAAYASAAIVGTSGGPTTLEITTGGTVTLNANDTYLTVTLDAAARLTLGKLAFITADGSRGGDTITASGASQTLIGGSGDVLTGSTSGSDTILGTSAGLNANTIGNWTTGDVIDITDMNSASLHALGFSGGKLTVADGTHTDSLAVKGTAGVTLALHNFTVLGADGHGGTLIGWHG